MKRRLYQPAEGGPYAGQPCDVLRVAKKGRPARVRFKDGVEQDVAREALHLLPQPLEGSRDAQALAADHLAARREDSARALRHLQVSRLGLGAKIVYQPPSGRGDMLHAGQPCEVVRAPDPKAAHPTARVQFAGGHELSAPVGHFERALSVYRPSAPPTPLHPVVEQLRERPGYRALLTLAAAELSGEDDFLSPVRMAQRAQTDESATRMLRRHVAAGGEGNVAELSAALLDVVRREAALRFDRRARQQRRPAASPVRPAELLHVQLGHIAASQRREANLIAAAILHGDVVHEKAPEPLHARLPSQPKAFGEAGVYEDAYREMVRHAQLAVRYLLAESLPLAQHHAQQADDARARFDALSAQLKRFRATQYTGRYHDGDRYRVDLPADQDAADGEVFEWQTHYFELILVWGADGFSLEVANEIEIEAASGVWVGAEGWGSLCRWLEQHDDRLERGSQVGRQYEDEEHLIYERDGEVGLRLRRTVAKKYPGIERALEAVRCLARVESRATTLT